MFYPSKHSHLRFLKHSDKRGLIIPVHAVIFISPDGMFAIRNILVPLECIKLVGQVVAVVICALFFFLFLEGLFRDCRELGSIPEKAVRVRAWKR